jgi:hypothetical protein
VSSHLVPQRCPKPECGTLPPGCMWQVVCLAYKSSPRLVIHCQNGRDGMNKVWQDGLQGLTRIQINRPVAHPTQSQSQPQPQQQQQPRSQTQPQPQPQSRSQTQPRPPQIQNVLLSPAPSDEPSPAVSNAIDSPNPTPATLPQPQATATSLPSGPSRFPLTGSRFVYDLTVERNDGNENGDGNRNPTPNGNANGNPEAFNKTPPSPDPQTLLRTPAVAALHNGSNGPGPPPNMAGLASNSSTSRLKSPPLPGTGLLPHQSTTEVVSTQQSMGVDQPLPPKRQRTGFVQ